MAATGHRPVTDPAESLDVIDLDAGWMVINDKQTHPGKAGRLVPLAPMVVAQLVGTSITSIRSSRPFSVLRARTGGKARERGFALRPARDAALFSASGPGD